MALTKCGACGSMMGADAEAKCPNCGADAPERAAKTWMNSKWRRIMLIVIAIDLVPIIYGLMLIAEAASRVGIANLVGNNYGNPALWISGAIIGGHCAILGGAGALFANRHGATEVIKIGAGVVFVFQSLAIAIAVAFWIGTMFKIGQGEMVDADENVVMLNATVFKEQTINAFLSKKMFATTWLSLAQMVMLMVAVEKERSEA